MTIEDYIKSYYDIHKTSIKYPSIWKKISKIPYKNLTQIQKLVFRGCVKDVDWNIERYLPDAEYFLNIKV